ncbi:MAG: hypothetical protein MUC51_08625 [Anaerolineae bacterium]|nr:hypothetical protein [Anaerolineae bacterium]
MDIYISPAGALQKHGKYFCDLRNLFRGDIRRDFTDPTLAEPEILLHETSTLVKHDNHSHAAIIWI